MIIPKSKIHPKWKSHRRRYPPLMSLTLQNQNKSKLLVKNEVLEQTHLLHRQNAAIFLKRKRACELTWTSTPSKSVWGPNSFDFICRYLGKTSFRVEGIEGEFDLICRYYSHCRLGSPKGLLCLWPRLFFFQFS
jgi:hypothetical protein